MVERSDNHPTERYRRGHILGMPGGDKPLPFLGDVKPVPVNYEAWRLLDTNVNGKIADDFRRLYLSNGTAVQAALLRHNIKTAVESMDDFAVVSDYEGKIIAAAAGSDVPQWDIGWIDDLAVDQNVDDRLVIGPMLKELEEIFEARQVRNISLAVSGDKDPGLFEELGYVKDTRAIVYEKPIPHNLSPRPSSRTYIRKVNPMQAGNTGSEAALLYTPSGTQAWILPPGQDIGATELMRAQEIWLGRKGVATARYIGAPDIAPFDGYQRTDTQIFHRSLV